MTLPGIGPITALCFKATVDDLTRFKRSRSVGAYVGLTTRRYASGEIDWTGRISKCGDAMLREIRALRELRRQFPDSGYVFATCARACPLQSSLAPNLLSVIFPDAFCCPRASRMGKR